MVVRELLQLPAEGGPRLMAAHRLALHWLFSICGVGPYHARGGLGWDAMLAALACTLGYHSVVLAASPNDNGLLHQEFVDFDLPPDYGWGVPPAGATNDVGYCASPFAWPAADKRAGPRAVGHRRRELLAYWERIGKFVLPAQPTDGVVPASDAHTAARCTLRFGAGGLDAVSYTHLTLPTICSV